jgi:hypothetical protein
MQHLFVTDQTNGFTGASPGAAGAVGLVSQPSAGQQNYLLAGDSTWRVGNSHPMGAILGLADGYQEMHDNYSVQNLEAQIAYGPAGWITTSGTNSDTYNFNSTGTYLVQFALNVGAVGSTNNFATFEFQSPGGGTLFTNSNQAWCAAYTSISAQPVINCIFQVTSPPGLLNVKCITSAGTISPDDNAATRGLYCTGFAVSLIS